MRKAGLEPDVEVQKCPISVVFSHIYSAITRQFLKKGATNRPESGADFKEKMTESPTVR